MNEIKMPDINIKIGQTTEVVLRSNAASTGYVWAISHKPDLLWLEGEGTYLKPGDIPGAPGKMTFTFTGAGKCQDYIQFILVRPWDLNDIAQKMTYAVIIS